METYVNEKCQLLHEQIDTYDKIKHTYHYNQQYKFVLEKTKDVILDKFSNVSRYEDEEQVQEKEVFIKDIDLQGTKLSYMACIINKDGSQIF